MNTQRDVVSEVLEAKRDPVGWVCFEHPKFRRDVENLLFHPLNPCFKQVPFAFKFFVFCNQLGEETIRNLQKSLPARVSIRSRYLFLELYVCFALMKGKSFHQSAGDGDRSSPAEWTSLITNLGVESSIRIIMIADYRSFEKRSTRNVF